MRTAGSYDHRYRKPHSSTQLDSRAISRGHAGRVHLFVLSNVGRSTRALQGCGFLAWLVRMGTQMPPAAELGRWAAPGESTCQKT